MSSLFTPKNSEAPGDSPQKKVSESRKSSKEKSLSGTAKQDGIELRLTLTKPKYDLDEEISIKLVLTNRGEAAKTLIFPDTQRFDIWVEEARAISDHPLIVWRWSFEMSFAQIIGEEVLEPGQKLTYKASWDQRWQTLPVGKYERPSSFPGRYTLFGVIGKESQVLVGPAKVSIVISE